MNGNNITMMMLGPRAVGKTTMLALMYKGLLGVNLNAHFDFQADDHDTAIDLDEAYLKLTEILNQPIFAKIEPLLTGDTGVIQRKFAVNFKGKKKFGFVFCDHGGGLVYKKDAPGWEEFREKLQKAIVIMNVLDGAALVEGSHLFSDKINRPLLICELLRKALNDKQEHLVLFVITKCETWLKDSDGRKAIEQAFETRYREVINVIASNPRNNVVGILMPVQTLGCVEFSKVNHYGEPGEEIEFIRKPNRPFQPYGIEQPLRYALAFALSQHNKNSPWGKKLLDKIFGKDVEFRNAFEQFANHRDKNYKMYGNVSLIL